MDYQYPFRLYYLDYLMLPFLIHRHRHHHQHYRLMMKSYVMENIEQYENVLVHDDDDDDVGVGVDWLWAIDTKIHDDHSTMNNLEYRMMFPFLDDRIVVVVVVVDQLTFHDQHNVHDE